MSGRSGGPNILLALARVARGRADGMPLFPGTTQGFLASLAPLIGFPVALAILMLMGGGGIRAVAGLLGTLCALLVPPVVSFELARLWRRQAAWLRFATAFNWCQWVVLLVGVVVMMVVMTLASASGAAAAGLNRAADAGLIIIVGYGLWLHWFLGRHGLQVSRLRAALLVVCVNLGTALVVIGPRLLLLERA
jgi:hypothetical protein